MFQNTRSPLVRLCLQLALAIAVLCVAAVGAFDEQQRQAADAKQQQNRGPDKPRPRSEYEAQLEQARAKFKQDPKFKAAVESAASAQKREHSEFAFAMNTRDRDDNQVTRSGDTFKIEDTLYDNPLAQQYVNRLGQSLVPDDSKNLYAFRITLNPVPLSRALSTGTIYISTGFISLVENEAQLAYILAHEIAHVEREHWQDDVLMQIFNEDREKGGGGWAGTLSKVVGSGVVPGVPSYGQLFLANVPTLVKLMSPGGVVGWDLSQENIADQQGLQYIVARNYDPAAVPALHAKLAEVANTEKRASFGFIGDPVRIGESDTTVRSAMNSLRESNTGRVLTRGAIDLSTLPPLPEAVQPSPLAAQAEDAAKAVAAIIEATKAGASLAVANAGQFRRVMAELKRDNGMQAFFYDMFSMSLKNLEDSLEIYGDDAQARLAYGRALWVTARADAQRATALKQFEEAIERDKRGLVPQAHLYKALVLIDRSGASAKDEIVPLLQQYVLKSRRRLGGELPPDMNAIYDYLQQVGETEWFSPPASAVTVLTQLEERPQPPVGPQPNAPTGTAVETPDNGRGGGTGRTGGAGRGDGTGRGGGAGRGGNPTGRGGQ